MQFANIDVQTVNYLYMKGKYNPIKKLVLN